MKTIFAALVFLFAGATAMSAERAVEGIHYEVNVGGRYLDLEFESFGQEVDGYFLSGTLDGEVTFPLGPYLGAFVGAAFDKSVGEQYDGDLEFDDESLGGRLGVFYRDPAIGRVLFGYELEETESSITWYGGSPYDSTEDVTSESYLALVEGYAGPVTLRLQNTRIFYEFDDRFSFDEDDYVDAAMAAVDWYVTPNVRLGVQIGLEDAEDSYSADIEFQPSFMGNVAGFSIGYFRADDSEDDSVTNGVSLAVHIYFDRRFDLKTRDRHYR